MLHALNIIEIVYKLLKPVSLIKCMIKKIATIFLTLLVMVTTK